MNKRGFHDGIVLVVSILVMLLFGSVLLIMLSAITGSTERSLQATSHVAAHHQIFVQYLSLPTQNPQGLVFVDALNSGDSQGLTDFMNGFVAEYGVSGCWEVELGDELYKSTERCRGDAVEMLFPLTFNGVSKDVRVKYS